MTQKVANPCGVVTSKLSVTLIGQYEQGAAERVARQAQQIRDQRVDFYKTLDASKRVHPVRRQLHMQKAYPDTVSKLQRGEITRKQTPQALRDAPYPLVRTQVPLQPPPPDARGGVDPARAANVHAEATWNTRYAEVNKTKGRVATVKDIITGDLPMPKHQPLFPVNGTHQQLLVIDKKITGGNPMVSAPPAAGHRRWLGDHVGWEGNRGLPTPDIGWHGKDGFVKPWPSSHYGTGSGMNRTA